MIANLTDVAENPDLYDLLYEDFNEDIPFYQKLTKNHKQLLECGIGSGRIAIPMAQNGKIVYGIDQSEKMLAKLREKISKYPKSVKERIVYFKEDIRKFDINHKFSFAYVPFFTFNYLLTLEDQISALASIKRHLKKEAEIVLEVISFSVLFEWLGNTNSVKRRIKKKDSVTGKIAEMWRTFDYDSSNQIIEQHRYYKIFDKNGVLEKEQLVILKNRYFTFGEIQLLLEISGFKILKVHGDYNFSPYRHESESIILVAGLKN